MKLHPSIRRFCLGQRGVATVEFVVTFPILFALSFLAISLSFTLVQSTLLDRALDLTVRDLRLGVISNPDMTVLERAVCDQMFTFTDCTQSLTLEFTRIDPVTFSDPPAMGPCTKRDPDAQAARAGETYATGAHNDLMLVRACVEVLNVISGVGDMQIYARSAYVVEPE